MISRLMLLVLTSVILTSCGEVMAQNVSVNDYKVILLDSFGETFNGVFKPDANTNVAVQDGITTYNGYQYAAFFNADHRLCLARRPLPQKNWEKIVFTDYLKTSADSHNGISIGIAANDGTMHLAFDHHVSTLRYKVSVPGLANDPTSHPWNESAFSAVLNYLAEGEPIASLTYPRFVPTPDGNLHFYYRHGWPGNGDCRIVRYDGLTSQWSASHKLIAKDGQYYNEWYGNSNSRSQYHNLIQFDSHGTLHTSFTWREQSQGTGTQYNHDIGYIFSEDGGTTWLSNNYEKVADLNTGLVASYFSPDIVVGEVAPELRMINDQAHAVDPKGEIHVVVQHLTTPAESPGIVSVANYRHHRRNALGQWRNTTLPFAGPRGKMLCDSRGNLLMMYILQGQFNIITASPNDDYTTWTSIFQGPVPSAKFIMDTQRFADSGELSIMVQQAPATLGDPTPIYVIDFELEHNEDCLVNSKPCEASTVAIKPTDDCSVRGGQYANQNFGSENRLAAKKAPLNSQNHVETYLRFKLDSLKGKSKIESAKLKLYVKQASNPGVQSTQYGVHFCESNFWTEAVLTYNSLLKPALTSLIDVQAGSTEYVEWDITTLLRDMVHNADWLTLAVTEMNASMGVLTFHSKEASNANYHPEIVVTYARNYIDAAADTYARGGVHAGTTHGSEIEIVVKDDGNDSFDREGYLKFDVSAYADEPVAFVTLQMHRKAMSGMAHTTPFAAHFVPNDSWEENELNWNNKPGYDPVPLSGQFARQTMDWDVTEAFINEANGDGILSLALVSTREGSSRNVNLYTKEEANPVRHPILIVRYGITPPAPPADPATAAIGGTLSGLEASVYPNPAHDNFTTFLNAQISGQATLYNASGGLVRQLPIAATDQLEISVAGLPAGIYLLRIADSLQGNVITKKVLKL